MTSDGVVTYPPSNLLPKEGGPKLAIAFMDLFLGGIVCRKKVIVEDEFWTKKDPERFGVFLYFRW